MDDLTPIIDVIAKAAKAEGLPSFAKRTGVPYTTLIDWERAGWRPKAIVTFERIAKAASKVAANDSLPHSEAA